MGYERKLTKREQKRRDLNFLKNWYGSKGDKEKARYYQEELDKTPLKVGK